MTLYAPVERNGGYYKSKEEDMNSGIAVKDMNDHKLVETENNRRINPTEEDEPRKLDIFELLAIADKGNYEKAKEYIKEKVCELPIDFLRECLEHFHKVKDYEEINEELREILE